MGSKHLKQCLMLAYLMILPVAANAKVKVIVQHSAYRVLVASDKSSKSTTYRAGDVVFDAPIAWAISAKILAPIVVPNVTDRVPAESIMPGVRIVRSDENQTHFEEAFCLYDKSSEIIAKTILSIQKIKANNYEGVCFSDYDNDGRIDKVFVLGAREKIGNSVTIDPVSIVVSDNNPIDNSNMRIQFDGTQFATSNPYFDFQITVNGKVQKAGSVAYDVGNGEAAGLLEKTFSIQRSGGWPQTFPLLGGAVQVADYTGGVLKMTWERPPRSGTFQLVASPRTIMIYIAR